MSRIDELIAELCPGGVPHRQIGDVAECYSGATPASGVSVYWEGGTIPWMGSGEVNKGTVSDTEKFITEAGYAACSTKMVPPGAVVIALAGQGKTRGKVARIRIALCTNQSLAAIIPYGSVNSDYLYYFLQTQYQQLRSVSSGDGTRGGLNLRMIRDYKVPVPPLEIQQEIARTLDLFTSLEAELEAELEARRRQYAHYRDSLLSFPEGGVRWVPLGELIRVNFGARITKAKDAGTVYPVYGGGGASFKTDAYNREDEWVVSRFAMSENCVRRVGGQFWMLDSGFTFECAVPDIEKEYVGQVLLNMQPLIFATSTQSAQKNIDIEGFKRLVIPVPPLREQRRIVAILDAFDALVNDLSIGLPAELSARRTQYEYYRDRLLTFKEAAA
ncbi:restriction endonuclease subunit S [Anaerosoma tenue]|uniref:restriction endonuclease subunit S n=1 Tax=Anaerosoma tenue TaxID=2933588 RepID=UPI0022609DD9|nr:restriction endonuclease subunit S [Anaerosoma tenue]MCK8115256.1 restriction endonuclease subunit S [Anaerosoma tenue]